MSGGEDLTEVANTEDLFLHNSNYLHVDFLLESVPCMSVIFVSMNAHFLARDVIYTSRTYATMSVSVCL